MEYEYIINYLANAKNFDAVNLILNAKCYVIVRFKFVFIVWPYLGLIFVTPSWLNFETDCSDRRPFIISTKERVDASPVHSVKVS